MITVGSLFSGIGGIDLGLERAGMKVIWQSEFDPYASKVLAKHWPDVPNLGDVKQIDWSTVERPDLLCGGYPCQPFSHAGQRGGTDDPRHLWPWFAHALRLLRPDWALLENVPGHLSLGFGDVLADLASLGFDAEWDLLPAVAVGAPHLRYRLFVVAHASGSRRWEDTRSPHGDESADAGRTEEDDHQLDRHGQGSRTRHVAHADGQRLEERWLPAEGRPDLSDSARSCRVSTPLADATSAGLERDGEGLSRSGRVGDANEERRRGRPRIFRPGGRRQPADPGWWESEPDVGRVAHGIPSRVDRLRCLGNAVVPQVAEYVGRRIIEADCHCPCHQTVQPGLVPCPSCDTGPDHSSRLERP